MTIDSESSVVWAKFEVLQAPCTMETVPTLALFLRKKCKFLSQESN